MSYQLKPKFSKPGSSLLYYPDIKAMELIISYILFENYVTAEVQIQILHLLRAKRLIQNKKTHTRSLVLIEHIVVFMSLTSCCCIYECMLFSSPK